MDLDVRTAFSRGFDAGNFANAYEGTLPSEEVITRKCRERTISGRFHLAEFQDGFLLGFYSSYELYEIPAEHRETLRALREKYPDHA